MKTLVLGIGNLLLCDEGIGVHAVRALIEAGCENASTTVMEVGTAILDALPAIEDAGRIIVLDAVKADGEPGSVYRMPFDDFVHSRCIASLHGFDLARVLALTRRNDVPDVVVIGMEPARIDWGLDLSPQAAKALPLMLDAVREEISLQALKQSA